MKVKLDDHEFDLDTLNLSDDLLIEDWNKPEGLFVRRLLKHPELISEMMDYCEKNIALLEILEPSNGPPGLATIFFENELKFCRKSRLGHEYFVNKLLLQYTKAFFPSVRHVLENHNGSRTVY